MRKRRISVDNALENENNIVLEHCTMHNKIKHLEMIENIIDRMSKNSFQLKGWSITIITVIGVLIENNTNKNIVYLVSIPIVFFWILDSYYLQTERKYRDLYKIVTKKNELEIDFNLDANQGKSLTCKEKLVSLLKCALSISEIIFYGSLFVMFVCLFKTFGVTNG